MRYRMVLLRVDNAIKQTKEIYHDVFALNGKTADDRARAKATKLATDHIHRWAADSRRVRFGEWKQQGWGYGRVSELGVYIIKLGKYNEFCNRISGKDWGI